MIFIRHKHPSSEHEEAARRWLHLVRPDGLRPDEYARGRELLSEYMALRPIRPSAAHRNAASPWQAFMLDIRVRSLTVAASAVFVALSAGTTAYAAEGALPGNPLYAIKVNVSEPIRGALIFSDTGKADWSVTRAARRLEEASTLAVTGALTNATRTELEQSLDSSIQDAEARSTRLAQQHDAAAASDIDIKVAAVLQAHAGVLAAIHTAASDGTRVEVASLLSDVAAHMDDASAKQSALAVASTSETGASSIDAQRAAAKAHIDTAASALASASGEQPGAVWSGAEAQLKAAQLAYANGEGSADAKDGAAAAASFSSALRAASEAAATVSARTHILSVLEKNPSHADDADHAAPAAFARTAPITATTTAGDERAPEHAFIKASARISAAAATSTSATTPPAEQTEATSTPKAAPDEHRDSPSADHGDDGRDPGVSAQDVLDALQQF